MLDGVETRAHAAQPRRPEALGLGGLDARLHAARLRRCEPGGLEDQDSRHGQRRHGCTDTGSADAGSAAYNDAGDATGGGEGLSAMDGAGGAGTGSTGDGGAVFFREYGLLEAVSSLERDALSPSFFSSSSSCQVRHAQAMQYAVGNGTGFAVAEVE
jgi:hypothetical protein